MWDKQASDLPHEPPLVCGDGYFERYADREREQGAGAYEDYYLTLVGTTKYGNRCNSLNISLL